MHGLFGVEPRIRAALPRHRLYQRGCPAPRPGFVGGQIDWIGNQKIGRIRSTPVTGSIGSRALNGGLPRAAGSSSMPGRCGRRTLLRPSQRWCRAPSAAAEIAVMADWARLKLNEQGFRAWICVPDLNQRRAEVVDAFDAALAPRRFALRDDAGGDAGAAPYAVAGGTPLADYAPVRAALAFLAASVGQVEFIQFSALLRAPELQDTDSEASARHDWTSRCAAAHRIMRIWRTGWNWPSVWREASKSRPPQPYRDCAPRIKCWRNCAVHGASANGLRCGWRPWKRVLGRFAAAGRASNIKQLSDSGSCSRA